MLEPASNVEEAAGVLLGVAIRLGCTAPCESETDGDGVLLRLAGLGVGEGVIEMLEVLDAGAGVRVLVTLRDGVRLRDTAVASCTHCTSSKMLSRASRWPLDIGGKRRCDGFRQ
jgi:hypothetical protein